MVTFANIVAFEIRQRLLSRGFATTLAVVFAIGGGAAWLLGSLISGTDAPGFLNTGYMAAIMTQVLGSLTLFAVLALTAELMRRDRDAGLGELIQATPAPDALIVVARFSAVLIFSLVLFSATIAGYEIGSRMPWINAGLAGPVPWRAYLNAVGLLGLSNAAIVAALTSLVAIASTNRFAPWVLAILLVVLVSGAQIGLAREALVTLAALVDPSGYAAIKGDQRYITRAEMSDWRVSADGLVLANRILWGGLGALALAGACVFAGRRAGTRWTGGRQPVTPAAEMQPVDATKPRAVAPDVIAAPMIERDRIERPRVQPTHSSFLPPFLMRLRFELRGILAGPWALLSVALPVVAAFPMLYFGWASEDDTQGLLPVTASVVTKLSENVAPVCALLAILFAGELVRRERLAGMSEIVDVTGTPALATSIAKLAAIGVLIALQLTVVSGLGIVYQRIAGAPQIDIGPYLARLLFADGSAALIGSAFAILVHTLIPQRVPAHATAIGVLTGIESLKTAGVEHHLLLFGMFPKIELSDMNGVGHYLAPAAWFVLLWGLVAAAMVCVADILRDRGNGTPLLARARAFASAPRATRQILMIATGSAVAVGGFIFWNVNFRNIYISTSTSERRKVGYEKRYGALVDTPQPRIVALDISVDLEPERRTYRVRGDMTLRNGSTVPITRVLIDFDPSDLVLTIPDASEIKRPNDPCCDVHEVTLKEPLRPGAEMKLVYTDTTRVRGMLNGDTFSIRYNGTNIPNSDLVPVIGVHHRLFLADDARRQAHKLPPFREAPGGRGSDVESFYSSDTDGMRFSATISTSADQTGVAPGTLVRRWQENGRNYFRYELAGPMDGDFAILSARYVTVEDKWGDIPIFVHHHPAHSANVEQMIDGMKAGLEYCVAAFGPYPFKDLRLAEFPYGTTAAATAQPGMISYAETAGFIADPQAATAERRRILETTVHETAHQWWGYRISPANRPGAQFLTESIAEYVSRMVARKRFGSAAVRNVVRNSVDQYLRKRGGALREDPLVAIDTKADQSVYYDKGSAALYALQEVVGEAAVNRSLARLMREYGGKTNPYPVASDLVRMFKEDLGARHHELIADLFERITLWHFAVKSAKTDQLPSGRWRTTLSLAADKVEATSNGAETARALNQTVRVDVYAKNPLVGGASLESALVVVKSGDQTVTFETKAEPNFVRINASRALIQRDITKTSAPVGR